MISLWGRASSRVHEYGKVDNHGNVGEVTNQSGGDYDIFPLEHRVEGAILIVVNIYVELIN
jgi:hypothetical protein